METGVRSDLTAALRRYGNILVDERFDRASVGPAVFEYCGQTYYRFMDWIYLNRRPADLSKDEVVAVCDLRSEFESRIVNRELNEKIARSIVKIAAKSMQMNPVVLDYGCGSGMSTLTVQREIPEAKLFGVDISIQAVNSARTRGIRALRVGLNGDLPFRSGCFDLVLAMFVMHFDVGIDCLKEIFRVLVPGGLLLYNSYGAEPEKRDQEVKAAGFVAKERRRYRWMPRSHYIAVWTATAPGSSTNGNWHT